ncbi:MAG: DUF3822 family protein [Bacteroidales bacterium]|nr:DUF3822 family protein [Bacteroidales bacterium]
MSYNINSLIKSEKVVGSYEKRLSICLSSNGFSFSMTSLHDELLAFGEVTSNLSASMSDLLLDIKSVFTEADIITYGLKEIELIVVSRHFVWVPQHLYDEKMERSYLEAIGKIATGEGVYSSTNDDIKAQIVFTAPNNVVSAFKIAMPGIKIRCQHDKLANMTLLESSDLRSILLVNIREGESDYAVLCNKKLQLSNTFKCNSFDETLYHAVNLTKQFHLEDASVTVAVCGNINREQFSTMRQFLPNVALYTGRQMTLSNPEMQHIPLYRHAVILS